MSIPRVYNMRQFRQRLLMQDGSSGGTMLMIGDSTVTVGNANRWGQSIIQNWQVGFKGYVAQGTNTATELNGHQTTSPGDNSYFTVQIRNATGGTFKLTWNGSESAAITYSTTQSTTRTNIIAALETIVGAGKVAVSIVRSNDYIVVLATGTSSALTVTHNSLTGGGATVSIPATNTYSSCIYGEYFPDGTGPNSTMWEYHCTRPDSSNDVIFDAHLTMLEDYPGGDWTQDANLTSRLLLHKPLVNGLAEPFLEKQSDTSYANYRRNGVLGSDVNPFNFSITPDYAGKNFTDSNAPGDSNGEVRLTTASFLNPPHQSVHWAGIEWSVPGNGMNLFIWGQGGVGTHRWTALEYDTLGNDPLNANSSLWPLSAISSGLELLSRKVNAIVIFLGLNQQIEEVDTAAGEAAFKTNLYNVVRTWKEAAETAGGTDVKILLIAPWGTSSGQSYARRRARAMYEVALAHSDYVSFMDLDGMMDDKYGANWRDDWLDVGKVHQEEGAIDPVGETSWEGILSDGQPSGMRGRLCSLRGRRRLHLVCSN